MEDSFGYLALAFFVVIGIVEFLYRIVDKRTGGGKVLRTIFHAVSIIIFIVVAVIYCFARE